MREQLCGPLCGPARRLQRPLRSSLQRLQVGCRGLAAEACCCLWQRCRLRGQQPSLRLQLVAPPAQTPFTECLPPLGPVLIPFVLFLAGTQTASGGTSAGPPFAAIVSPFAALRMDPLQEGDEALQGSPVRPGPALSAGPQGSTAAPAGFLAAPVDSGEALRQLMEQLSDLPVLPDAQQGQLL